MQDEKYCVLLFLSLSLFACSTLNSFNDTLNGTWELSTIDGILLPLGASVTYAFTKTDNTNGNCTRTSISGGINAVVRGIYALSTDFKLSLKFNGTNTIDYESITSHTATNLPLLDQNGHIQYLLKH